MANKRRRQNSIYPIENDINRVLAKERLWIVVEIVRLLSH